MIFTISQKTNKPLCWNINLDLRYNIWSLSVHPKQAIKKYNFFVSQIRMINLSLNKLKLIAKSRGIKDYEKKNLKSIYQKYSANQNQK